MGLRVYPARRKKRYSFDLAPETSETEPIVEGEEPFLPGLRQRLPLREEFDLEEYLPRLGVEGAAERAEPSSAAEKEITPTGTSVPELQEQDFGSFEEYDAWKEGRRSPRAQRYHDIASPYKPSGRLYSWIDPVTNTQHVTGNIEEVPSDVPVNIGGVRPKPEPRPIGRSPRAQMYHDIAERTRYVPTGNLYSWVDPRTGTRHVTGNAAEVPPDIAADVFEPRVRQGTGPKAEEVKPTIPPPAAEPKLTPAADYRTLPKAPPIDVTKEVPEEQIQQIAKASMIDVPQEFDWGAFAGNFVRSLTDLSREEQMRLIARGHPAGRSFQKATEWAINDLNSKSRLLGTVVPSSGATFEAALASLPFHSVGQIWKQARDRALPKEGGLLSQLEAGARSFGDMISVGGDQQLELDFARKLVLADPEVHELARQANVSDDELEQIVFPEGKTYTGIWSFVKDQLALQPFRGKYRGAMPLTRRMRYDLLQDVENYHDLWREKRTQYPELMDTIVKKTVGAIQSGYAWEHFNEQGIIKGLAHALPTDPFLALGIVFGLVGSGLKGGAAIAGRGGALKTARVLEEAAAVVPKARRIAEPVEETAKAVGKVARAAAGAAKPTVRKAAAKVLPEAEYGIRRALWTKALPVGKKGRMRDRAFARLATIVDDADLVEAHRSGLMNAMKQGLIKAGMTSEDVAKHGAKIERIATLAHKTQRQRRVYIQKGMREAEKLLKGLPGKTLTEKGKLTPLGRVVNWLDTGEGFEALAENEKAVATQIRKTLDELKAKMPEDVGRIEHYFPRFQKVHGDAEKQFEVIRKALGREGQKYWEEARKVDVPAVRLYESRDDVINGLGRRLAGQNVAEVDESINKMLSELIEGMEGVKRVEPKLKGYRVEPTVKVGEKDVSLEQARRLVKIQRAKATEASMAAAERIEKRITEAEQAAAREIAPRQFKAAPERAARLAPQVREVEKRLAAAEDEIAGLGKPMKRAERMQAKLERLKSEKEEVLEQLKDVVLEPTENQLRQAKLLQLNKEIKKAKKTLSKFKLEPEFGLDDLAAAQRIDELHAERAQLLGEALEKQADDALEAAEKQKWVDAIEKKIERIDRQYAKIEAALPPEESLAQMSRQLDLSYKNRAKLEKDLIAKRKKLKEYNDFTKAKPVYREEPIDVGKEFTDFVRGKPIVETELEALQRVHRKGMRIWKTALLGWRPSYAGRNAITEALRMTNEMLNGAMQGTPWRPTWERQLSEACRMGDAFWFESLRSRDLISMKQNFFNWLPRHVYQAEGMADRMLKSGTALGKVRQEIMRLARLNEVPTAKRHITDVIDELRHKGVITDFPDLVRQYGRKEADRILFNFGERVGLMIGVPGELMPFAEWGYKNFNYVLKDLTRHPWKLRAWKIAYDQWAHEHQDKPEYYRHVTKLFRDGPNKFMNNLYIQPLWNVGGFEVLSPFLEGSNEFDDNQAKMFEPVIRDIMERAKAENWSFDEREKEIDRVTTRMLKTGVGSLRGYLDRNYLNGSATGYRYNKRALKEMTDYGKRVMSSSPVSEMALSVTGMGTIDPSTRPLLGNWQTALEGLGLGLIGKAWLDVFIPEGREEYLNRKIEQEMKFQQIRGEPKDRRRAEKAVALQRAIPAIANVLFPVSMTYISPEYLELSAQRESARLANTAQVAVSDTPATKVYEEQTKTGKDYVDAKMDLEARKAKQSGDYMRVREIASTTGATIAVVPQNMQTPKEKAKAAQIQAAVNVVEALPEDRRQEYIEARGLEDVLLSNITAPSLKRLDGDYYKKAYDFIEANSEDKRREMYYDRTRQAVTDVGLQAFRIRVGEQYIGAERTWQYAKQWLKQLADDCLAIGDANRFEAVLREYPRIIEYVDHIEGGTDFIREQRLRVMEGRKETPENLRGKLEKFHKLVESGQHDKLIQYTNGLSSTEISAIKDHMGVGFYDEQIKAAKQIQEQNEASELVQNIYASDDTWRAYEDLNTNQKNMIEEYFPELDIKERIAAEKKFRDDTAEEDEWAHRVAESNYDLRFRKMVPTDVQRRLADRNMFWFDFFYPSERELAQKKLQKEREAKEKQLEEKREKRRELLQKVASWRQKIEASGFDKSYKGARVPIEVKRELADQDERFAEFFFGAGSRKHGVRIHGSRRRGGGGYSPRTRVTVKPFKLKTQEKQ